MPHYFESWSSLRFGAASLVLLAAALLAGSLIKFSDKSFPPMVKTRNSSALEWVTKQKEASDIVTEWKIKDNQGAMPVAYRGLLIDTVLFIPLYSTLIAVVCFWAAHVSATGSVIQKTMLVLAWCGWIAGALDLVENAGIFVQECFRWHAVALPTAMVAWTKWRLAIGVSLVAVVRLLVAAVYFVVALLLRKNGV